LAWGVMSPSSTTPTQIYFENLSQVETYTVYWVDFAGVEKKYYTLTPLESYTQNTYLWHIWVVRDSQRNIATTYTSLYNWDVVSVGIKSLPVETKRAEVSTMPILASGMGIYKIISKPTIFSKYDLCSSWLKLKSKNGRRNIKIQTNTMGILYASEVTKESQNEIWLTNVYSPQEKKYYNKNQHVVVQCN
jgi:hypothetical protein